MVIEGPLKTVTVTCVRENGLVVADGASTGWIDLLNLRWGNESVRPLEEFAPGQRMDVIVDQSDDQGRFFASLKHAHPEQDPFATGTPSVGEHIDAEVVHLHPAYALLRLKPRMLAVLRRPKDSIDALRLGATLSVQVIAVRIDALQIEVEASKPRP